MRKSCLILAFLILSLLDLVLTWHLVSSSGGLVYEANPLAGKILAGHGWASLAVFKMICASIFAGIAMLLFRLRPRTGLFVAAGGTGAMAVVVGYSIYLAGAQPWASDPQAKAILAHEAERREELAEDLAESRRYGAKLDQLSTEVVQQRRTLIQATEELARYLAERSYDPLVAIRYRFRGYDDRACLALVLARHVSVKAREDERLSPATERALRREFESHFRRPVPSGVFPSPPNVAR